MEATAKSAPVCFQSDEGKNAAYVRKGENEEIRQAKSGGASLRARAEKIRRKSTAQKSWRVTP